MSKIKEELPITCFNCTHYNLCHARNLAQQAIQAIPVVNINTNDTPTQMTDVFVSLAGCCTSYKQKK